MGLYPNWQRGMLEVHESAGSNPARPTRVKAIYVLVDIDADRCTDIAPAFAARVGIRYVVETQWRSGRMPGE